MKTPDFPPNEGERLEALKSLDVLDTPAEERFDRLTRMAKRIFQVPIALVSLVDMNRQWFKSCHGLPVLETPRDISFCGHAILGDEAFVIENALDDPRFADNPLVTGEPNIRFYAGVPLHSVTGAKLGTLCIIDQKPRAFDADDIEVLSDLAGMAERELAAIQLATLDELTGISNRRGFELLGRQSLSVCERHGLQATLVFLDLDGFKAVNDRFGHSEGDRALVAFANQMKHAFRESDLFARLGGDEFAVLLTNADQQEAEEIIGRFREALNEYNCLAARGYSIEFSAGTVRYDRERHQSLACLLDESDTLMYEQKQDRSAGTIAMRA